MKVAIFGKIRSGKDTVGNYLIKEFGFERFAFGDGIGEIIEKYFPEALEGGKPRKHYQHIGQEMRKLNPEVWINYLLRTIERRQKQREQVFHAGYSAKPSIDIVITDGRQVNEAERLRAEGFLILKVVCPEEIRIGRMKALGDKFNLEDLNHETELNVDRIVADFEIINDGTEEELKEQISSLVLLLGGAVNE